MKVIRVGGKTRSDYQRKSGPRPGFFFKDQIVSLLKPYSWDRSVYSVSIFRLLYEFQCPSTEVKFSVETFVTQ